jgi:hypothetical protein
MNILFPKCSETVERILKETRNRPDIEVQRALIDAFPFHKSNIVAWRVYGKEIKRQSGRVMFGL